MKRPILTVLSGLPGAGKTTLSRRIADETGAVIVCRDELRASLVNLTDEGALTLVTVVVARQLLELGHSVVVDAWNLHIADVRAWTRTSIAADSHLDFRHLDTPIDLCIERDSRRPNPNGEARIRSAAMEYGLAA